MTEKYFGHFIINFAHSEKYFLLTIGVLMSGLGDSRIFMIKICFESLFELFLRFFEPSIAIRLNILLNTYEIVIRVHYILTLFSL